MGWRYGTRPPEIAFGVSREQKEKIKAAADAAGETVADFIRSRILREIGEPTEAIARRAVGASVSAFAVLCEKRPAPRAPVIASRVVEVESTERGVE